MKKRKYRFTNLNNFLGRRLIFYITTCAYKPLFYVCLDRAIKNDDFSPPALFDLYCTLLRLGFTCDKVEEYLFVGVHTKYLTDDECKYYKYVYRCFFDSMRLYEKDILNKSSENE